MEKEKMIRFIDAEYHTLFFIKDGERIKLKFPDGSEEFRTCSFIDGYHTKVGYHVFYICELAEWMQENGVQYVPEYIPELPERCFSTLPSTGDLIIIRRGERRYEKSGFSEGNPERNKLLAEQLNNSDLITRQQEMAMLNGVLYGWNTEAAKVENYDFYGKTIRLKNIQKHKPGYHKGR